MIAKFQDFITENNLIDNEDKILLSVSGGRDSIALFYLFQSINVPFDVCHCNYHLRQQDSCRDEKFVEKLCEEHNIKFHVVNFNTDLYAKTAKTSIEIAARNLRYQWYESLCVKYGYTKIATAHHLNDQAETFMINLLRATGINGVTGIPICRELNSKSTNKIIKNCKIIRPLLFATRKDIDELLCYGQYVDDCTNFTDKYLRNKIRLNLIPEFEKLAPDFILLLQRSVNQLKNTRDFTNKMIEKFLPVEKLEKHYYKISIPEDFDKNEIEGYLYFILSRYGFNLTQITNITGNFINRSIGSIFYGEKCELLIDRNALFIKTYGTRQKIRTTKSEFPIMNFPQFPVLVDFDNEYCEENAHFFEFEIIMSNNFGIIPSCKDIACVDYDKINFPIRITERKTGDYFYPLGMYNKKKVSDFLIDNKINQFEKDKMLVVRDKKDNIIWLVGQRIDNRYKIQQKTKKILKISYTKDC